MLLKIYECMKKADASQSAFVWEGRVIQKNEGTRE